MKRFKNILLVAGPDVYAERALRHAVQLAQANGAKLSIVTVVTPLPWEAKRLARFVPAEKLQQHSEQEERDHLDRLAEAIGAQGITATTHLRRGAPFIEIIREVIRREHDLLIKAPTGTADPKPSALSSLDMHLVRKCPCPVWMIKPGQRRRFARILAAVNPDPEDPGSRFVNGLIMDLATSLAHTEQAELHIVNAWSVHGEATLRSLQSQLPEEQFTELIHELGEARNHMLLTLAGRYDLDGIVNYVQVLKGHPENAIPALVTRKGIDLVVMGSVEHANQPGVLIGNTAEDILLKLHCSTLTVKPVDFRTPVTLDDSV